MRAWILAVVLAAAGAFAPAHADRLRAALGLCLDPAISFDGLKDGLTDLGYRDATDRDLWLMAETHTMVTIFNFFSTNLPNGDDIERNHRLIAGAGEFDFVHILSAGDGEVLQIRRDPSDPTVHDYHCIFGFREMPNGLAAKLFDPSTDARTDDMGYYKMTATLVKGDGKSDFRLIADLNTKALDAALPDRPGVAAVVMTALKLENGDK